MKLLHILPGFDSAMGGTVAFVKAWAQFSSKEGCTSTVLSLGNKLDLIQDEGYEVVSIASKLGTYRYSKGLIPWLERNIMKFDAVVIHGIWQYHSFGAWRVLHRHLIPYIVFPHGMLDDWFRRTYPLKHLKKSLYWYFAESKVLRDAKAVIYTSADELVSSEKAFFPYQTKDVVCSLGISDPPSDDLKQRTEFFARFPCVRGKRIILFLGRLHCKKGCDLLIRAFADVYRDRTEMILVMAGPEGEVGYESDLRKLAQTIISEADERVVWTGMLNGDLKWGALRSAELFVLPSHQENFGMAVVESLACGTPVFVSSRVNIWREIEEGGAGLVEEDTFKGVSEGLSRWIKLVLKESASIKEIPWCYLRKDLKFKSQYVGSMRLS